jgi:osomolarity two-component system sensor histidine kinase NIK1
MSRSDETLATASSILRGLARGSSQSSSLSNGLKIPPYQLPGDDSAAKNDFESELAALVRRIQYLETRAEVAGRSLPDTPGEVQNPASPLSRLNDTRGQLGEQYTASPQVSNERAANNASQSRRVVNLLAARETLPSDTARTVSEDDIGVLREHVEKQAEQIKTQRETIAEISQGLRDSEEQAKQAFIRVENEDVSLLERELRKHQQANEAFQKALREIGGIITQVANGDLSKRVQIQATEMDDEIATFKVTINTMMDQLEVFGSEVSRVAREVGTEGILGGQAQISGLHGIWKELTNNGKAYASIWMTLINHHVSEHNGSEFDRSSPRNCYSHQGGRLW